MTSVNELQVLGRCSTVLLALLTLSQCALPPGSAWTVIRRDGFKDYLAVSWGKKPVPEYVKELLPEAFGETRKETSEEKSDDKLSPVEMDLAGTDEFPPLPSELPEDWTRPVEPVFPLMSTDPPEFPSLTPPIVAQNESPNPPLLSLPPKLDEFAQVYIPDFLNDPSTMASTIQGEASKPAPGLKMKEAAPVAEGAGAPASAEIGVSAATAVSEATPVNSPATPEIVSTEPVKKTDSIEKFLPATSAASSVETTPFGINVPGRPGYVRSPFAKEHQLVDVTGLKVGESVTCPFSGKAFRVPAAHEAMNPKPPAKTDVPSPDSEAAKAEAEPSE